MTYEELLDSLAVHRDYDNPPDCTCPVEANEHENECPEFLYFRDKITGGSK